jgi:hypothetical protein
MSDDVIEDLKIERDSRFLYAEDFRVGEEWKQFTLTIAKVHGRGEFQSADKKTLDGYSLSFGATDKVFVLNATNQSLLTAQYGGNAKDWIGKPVTLYPVELTQAFGQRNVPALRVRVASDTLVPFGARKHMGRDLTKGDS